MDEWDGLPWWQQQMYWNEMLDWEGLRPTEEITVKTRDIAEIGLRIAPTPVQFGEAG